VEISRREHEEWSGVLLYAELIAEVVWAIFWNDMLLNKIGIVVDRGIFYLILNGLAAELKDRVVFNWNNQNCLLFPVDLNFFNSTEKLLGQKNTLFGYFGFQAHNRPLA
jgi:hypothetical protein